MSTHPERYPMRKRQRYSQLHKQHTPPQLRLLAPKSHRHPASPVQYRLHLEQNNTQDEQDTDVKLQDPATSQSDILILPSLYQSDRTVLSLERKQNSEVAPHVNIYSNRVPLTSADYGIPELALGSLVSGVVTSEGSSGCHGLSAHHLPDNNLQFQETRHGARGDYCIPMLEDATMMQPTIGTNQSQCSTRLT